MRIGWAAIGSAVLLLQGVGCSCGGESGDDTDATPDPGPTDPGSPVPLGYHFQGLASGFDRPVDLVYLADGRALVAGQAGALTLIASTTEAIGEVTLDGIESNDGDEGVLAIALDPAFGSGSDFLYVLATTDPGLEVSILRFALSATDDAVSVSDRRVLFTLAGTDVTAAGDLAFQDGHLFVATGAGAPASDAPDHFGGVLRFVVDPSGELEPAPGNLDESLYSSGYEEVATLAAFNHAVWLGDRTGSTQRVLYAADPGDGVETALSYANDDETRAQDDLDYPGGAEGRAVVIGCVNVPPEGADAPDDPYDGELRHHLLYADAVQGWVRAAAVEEAGAGADLHVAHFEGVRSMTQSPSGHIVAVRPEGDPQIARLLKTSPGSLIGDVGRPLSEEGVFDDVSADPLVPLDGVLPYGVLWPLWADGHDKDRYVVLPDGETVDATDPARWVFPIGTRFFKTFTVVETIDGVERDRKVETRILQKTGDTAWSSGTYVWNFDETEAYLSDGVDGRTLQVQVSDDPPTRAPYYLPSVGECARCHGPNLEWILGFSHFQLGDEATTTLGDLWAPALGPAPVVTGTPEEIAARGFLHGNCSHCHQPEPYGIREVDMNLRFDVTQAEMNVVDVVCTSQRCVGETRIVPGDPDSSALFRLAEEAQMPPLAVTESSADGIEALRAWIQAM